jgi:hypothetical protein
MRLTLKGPPRFRPSDSNPHRFYLWLCLGLLGGCFIVLGPPSLIFVGALFTCLGGLAAGKPAEPDRADTFPTSIYLGVIALMGLSVVLYNGSSSQVAPRGSEMPIWAKVLVAVGLATYLAVEARRFHSRRKAVAA